MENKNINRILKFIIGCIGFRLCLVYLAATKKDLLPTMGKLAIIPCIGFMTIYLFGLRKTGMEVGGNLIWWNHLRPVHSLLWGIFAYLAIHKNNRSWIVLLIDVLVGLTSFILKMTI